MRVACVAVAFISGTLTAQTNRTALATDAAPSSLAEAEEAGARFPAIIPRRVLPSPFADAGVSGSAQRRCVPVQEESTMRAGDFLVGPFAAPGKWWAGGQKLWWVPASEAGELRVVAVHLDRATPTQIFHQPGVAHPPGSPSDAFHPTRIWLPAAGRWILVATSGTSWGCIVVDVPN